VGLFFFFWSSAGISACGSPRFFFIENPPLVFFPDTLSLLRKPPLLPLPGLRSFLREFCPPRPAPCLPLDPLIFPCSFEFSSPPLPPPPPRLSFPLIFPLYCANQFFFRFFTYFTIQSPPRSGSVFFALAFFFFSFRSVSHPEFTVFDHPVYSRPCPPDHRLWHRGAASGVSFLPGVFFRVQTDPAPL